MDPVLIVDESADSAWRGAARALKSRGAIQESQHGSTREIRHVAICIRNPKLRVTYARPINPAFAIAELIWMLAGGTSLEFLEFWNPRLRRLLMDYPGLPLYGAYGARLGLMPNLSQSADLRLRPKPDRTRKVEDQLRNVRETIESDPNSRQLILQIWDASYDLPRPRPRSKDIPCNVMSHMLVRNREIEWLQISRSTDVVWGLPYDVIHFTYLQELVAAWTGMTVGCYTHLSDSLHVYEDYWSPLEDWMNSSRLGSPTEPRSFGSLNFLSWESDFSNLVDDVLEVMDSKSSAKIDFDRFLSMDRNGVHSEWLTVLMAERLAQLGADSDAEICIGRASECWATSWRIWRAEKRRRRKHDETY